MHLATKGNNKILRRTNKTTFLKLNLHKVDPKLHLSPLCPFVTLTYTTRIISSTASIRTTLSPLDLWTDPAGMTALLAT